MPLKEKILNVTNRIGKTKKEKKALEEEIGKMRLELEDTQTKLNDKEIELRKIEAKLNDTEAELMKTKTELSEIQPIVNEIKQKREGRRNKKIEKQKAEAEKQKAEELKKALKLAEPIIKDCKEKLKQRKIDLVSHIIPLKIKDREERKMYINCFERMISNDIPAEDADLPTTWETSYIKKELNQLLFKDIVSENDLKAEMVNMNLTNEQRESLLNDMDDIIGAEEEVYDQAIWLLNPRSRKRTLKFAKGGVSRLMDYYGGKITEFLDDLAVYLSIPKSDALVCEYYKSKIESNPILSKKARTDMLRDFAPQCSKEYNSELKEKEDTQTKKL